MDTASSKIQVKALIYRASSFLSQLALPYKVGCGRIQKRASEAEGRTTTSESNKIQRRARGPHWPLVEISSYRRCTGNEGRATVSGPGKGSCSPALWRELCAQVKAPSGVPSGLLLPSHRRGTCPLPRHKEWKCPFFRRGLLLPRVQIVVGIRY